MAIDVLEREIRTKEELQEALNSEGYDYVTVNDYTLAQNHHTHPTTGEDVDLWGAVAQVTVKKEDGSEKLWTVEKDNTYLTVAKVSMAIVAYIEMVCCKN